MEMEIINKITSLDIIPYRFDKNRNSFICRTMGGSDSVIFKSMIKIVTILEEEKNPYAIFDRDVQLLDKAALDTAESIVVKLDHKGNVTYFNPYACNVTGYKEDEVLGKNWFKYFIPVKEEHKLNEVFKDIMTKKTPAWKYSNTIICKDNTLKMIDWENNKIRENESSKELVLSIGIVAS